MTTPPTSSIPPASGFPDRQRSRAVVGTFVLVILGLMALRAYAPHLRARPTDSSSPPRPVDLNTADRTELMQVPGVGPERADAILAHRAASGPFGKVADLDAVHGIGGKTLDKVRPFVAVGGGEVEKLERKPPPAASTSSSGKIKPGEPPIDVNAASLAELQRLPGIGPVMAQKIIDYRETKRFESVEELRKVNRLGVKTFDGLRNYVVVK